jgi:small subunit ribosomal protein S3
MAERLASAIERGWYFRKAGSSILRRVMDAGALGCEVIIAGKLTGPRARVQKFMEGYIKHAGEPSKTVVERGYAIAVKKLGVIGVQVKIVPPDAKLPDTFLVIKRKVEPAPPKVVVTEVGEEMEPEMSEAPEIPDIPGEES